MAGTDEAVKGTGHFECKCGRKFVHGARYTSHALKCDGTTPATSGRIAARTAEAAAPRAKRSAKRSTVRRATKAVPVPRPRSRSEKRKRVPQVDVVKPISPAAFIAALKAERAKIDAAIAAVEALA